MSSIYLLDHTNRSVEDRFKTEADGKNSLKKKKLLIYKCLSWWNELII